MMRLLVIADDYTGALDTGTQFAKQGISATLSLYDSLTAETLAACREQVFVVDTESRHLPAHEAAERVHAVTRLAKAHGFRYFFKKTDSTLRGNIGSELEAMQRECGAQQLYFAPAYPALGRTTERGVHYVNGIALSKTEFASDPFNPVTESNVAALVLSQCSSRAYTVQPGQLRPLAHTPEMVIVNARTDDDLLIAAQALSAADRLTCLAGCAGFAAALAKVLPFHTAPCHWVPQSGGRLLVSGSIHPQSVTQCLYAVQQCKYADRPLTLRQMLSRQDDCTQLVTSVCETLSAGDSAVVRVAGGRELLPDAGNYAESLCLDETALPARIAWKLGYVTQQIIQKQPPALLTVFGGDTLMGIAAALRCQNITPVTELLPGIVLSQMHTKHGCLDLITKAGGFGSEALLSEIEERLAIWTPTKL